jgi:ADP-ribose pyrophosphatase
MDETAHLYRARELTASPARSDDEHEFVHAEPVPFARALDWVRSGEIVDSMTIIAVLRAALARTGG